MEAKKAQELIKDTARAHKNYLSIKMEFSIDQVVTMNSMVENLQGILDDLYWIMRDEYKSSDDQVNEAWQILQNHNEGMVRGRRMAEQQ